MVKTDYYCINCMHPSKDLYHKFSSEVIRLKECENCGNLVDKYVEYDTVLVVIDLIIHYSTAYKHFLYNIENDNFLRLTVIFCFCDAYDKWIGERALLLDAAKAYDLEWIFYKSLAQSFMEMFTFIVFVAIFDLLCKNSRDIKFIAKSTMLGYYGNVAVVLSIIFRLSNDFSYRLATQIFLFISHIQVQRALFPSQIFAINFIVIVIATLLSTYIGTETKNLLNSIDS